jgi:hypothetical protein
MGGILPTDTFQDVPIESIEIGATLGAAGALQYQAFLLRNPVYPSIGFSFVEQYTSGSALRVNRMLDTAMDHAPNLGPNAPGIDFTKSVQGKRVERYHLPVYKAATYNPVVALAIVRVAEKNLPFVDFASALKNLPNLGPTEVYPAWRDDVDFFDEDVAYRRKPTDLRIRIAFLPDYYRDGRHAVGFYTRKARSGSLGAVVFAPCTVADLKAAKRWRTILLGKTSRSGLVVASGSTLRW